MTHSKPAIFSLRFSLSSLGLAAFLVAGGANLVAAEKGSGKRSGENASNTSLKQSGECQPNETQQALLDRVNDARSQPRECGDQSFEAAEPLVWSCTLADAARAHSKAMVQGEFFSHAGAQGEQVTDRVDERGYEWRMVGENIAAGQRSVDTVVDGWLSSPGHCANIMKEGFTEMGAARVEAPDSQYSPFWTQVFARPL